MTVKFLSPMNGVRRVRTNKSITQQQLADMVGIPRTLLSLIETGRVMPVPSIAERIATALEKPMEAIFDLSA